MTHRNAVAIVENFWKEVWQSRNPDAIDALVAEDFGITSGGVLIESRPLFKQWVARFLASINDFRFEVVESFQDESGSRVVSRWVVTGRNNGFMGSHPCQSPIRMTGTAVMHVRPDGLLQHNWVERSALEVHRSLAAANS
ncbi:ester cyclase [Cupriavidus pampae]|uniref:SnoaL-like polyketide cyclase n=1 Tax=Cupriavidus pampae TaxID=659251 RepID=A0ABM8XZ46_9BURK|nr:nuclear transport factor 2 family protein [Cupriavidus pampae]CAG9185662.1 hypothetical protein LMG32289_06033 [Cupriavidus pampae]